MLAEYTRDEAKAFAREHLRGIYSAIPVPETADHEIDEDGLRHNVRHCVERIGSGGIYVHGFYGNFWLMTTPERQRVLEVVAEEVGDRVGIVCRCAHQSAKDTIELMQHAERRGADIVSLLPPAFGQASDDVVYAYFAYLSQHTRLGFSVFNTPHAGYTLSPELLARLAEIPNVVALKNAMPMDHTIRVRELVGDEVLVVDPFERNLLVNALHFGQRVVYTYANYLLDTPDDRPMHDYLELAIAGDGAAAAKRHYEIADRREVMRKWVVERGWQRWGHCPVSTVKRWCEELGMRGGATRPPLTPLPPEEEEELLADLTAVGLRSPVAASA